MNAESDRDGWRGLASRLRDLKHRIDEFKLYHMSNDERMEKAAVLRRWHDEIGARIDAAIARGDVWQSVGSELERDFGGLSEAITEAIVRAGEPTPDAN